MTRYVMVVDLNRCVGCQTCSAACKQANATAPGVQWRRVLDFESGTYPDVRRFSLPVGCNHCSNAPCASICPTRATHKRPDGIIAIDYDLCIGCAYCIQACPFQARSKVDLPNRAYGDKRPMEHELRGEHYERRSVAQKCTFCSDRIDSGLANGLVPGVDPDATPACANACIAGALTFGDLDDPESRVSRLLAEHEHFRMHEELGTEPNLYYIWERKP